MSSNRKELDLDILIENLYIRDYNVEGIKELVRKAQAYDNQVLEAAKGSITAPLDGIREELEVCLPDTLVIAGLNEALKDIDSTGKNSTVSDEEDFFEVTTGDLEVKDVCKEEEEDCEVATAYLEEEDEVDLNSLSDSEFYDTIFKDGKEGTPSRYYSIIDELNVALIDCNKDVLTDDNELEEVTDDILIVDDIEPMKGVVPEENKISESKDTTSKTKMKKAKGFFNRKIIKVIASVVSIVALVGTTKFLIDLKPMSLEQVSSAISGLYTSESKEGLKEGVSEKQLLKFYDKLEKVDTQDEDTKSKLLVELSTILYYINDREVLDTILSDSYDLSSPDLLDKISRIENNSKNYTVSGLALDISGKINKARTNYNNYISLKSELSLITDYNSFSEDVYLNRIGKVSSKVNRAELIEMVNKIVNKKELGEVGSSTLGVEDTLSLRDEDMSKDEGLVDKVKDFLRVLKGE